MRMQAGEFFGESALQSADQTRQANVVAVGPVTALRLTRESFTTLLGDLRDVMKHNFNHKVLAGMDMFKGLNNAEREKLIDNLQEVKFAKGTEIIKQGDAGETFYIVKSGAVKVTQMQEGVARPETIKEGLSSGDYFGEMSLLESQPRMATVTATTDDVVLMSLDRATFTSLLGPLGNILNREASKRHKEAEKAKKPVVSKADLKMMTILGVGQATPTPSPTPRSSLTPTPSPTPSPAPRTSR